jgi:PAS domain-containing protein
LLLTTLGFSLGALPAGVVLIELSLVIALVTLELLQRDEQSRQRTRERAIWRVVEELAPIEDLNDLFDYVVHAILGTMAYADRCVIHLLDADGQRLYPHFSSQPGDTKIVGIPLVNTIAGEAVATRAPVVLEDVATAPGFLHLDSSVDIRSILVAPLKIHDRVLGTISINSASPGAFGEHDLFLARILAAQLASALYQSRLRTQTHQETRYVEAIIDRLADGLVVLDGANCVLRYNPAVAHLLGANVTQILGQPVAADSDWPGLRLLARLLAAAPTGGDPAEPYQVAIEEPVRATLRVTRTRISGRNGDGAHMLVLRDETTQEDLRQTQDALALTFSERAGTLAQAVIGLSAQVGNPRTLHEVQRGAREIEHEALALADLLSLDSSGERELSTRELEQTIRRAAAAGQWLADAPGVQVAVQCHLPDKDCFMDPERMERLLSGLISHVVGRLASKGRVVVEATCERTQLLVSIAAVGRLSEESAHDTPAAPAGSADLPLALSIAQARHLGGHLWTTAAAGSLRVSVALPLRPADSGQVSAGREERA